MNDSESPSRLKRNRNITIAVAVIAGGGAMMRWLGVYGAGPGTVDSFSIILAGAAIVSAINIHRKLTKLN
ncbi:MAG: hypothetical protein ACI9PZ_002725 [Parvicella sp.]|jgi:hypothetical protein